MHQHVRNELWGYAPDEQLTNEALIQEEYRGIRPAPGYPACPDHSLKPMLFDLLDATHRTGITLTESFAMLPTAAVSAASTSATRKPNISASRGSARIRSRTMPHGAGWSWTRRGNICGRI